MKRKLGQKLSLLPFIFLPLFAKSYFYPKIKTDIYLLPNGDVRICQERTYSFTGSFSWAFIDLKKKGAKDIIFNRLAELTEKGWQDLEAIEVQNNENSLYLRWHYKAEDEEKTFLLDYTILGAVKRYLDVAEFYWKIIEEVHEKISEIEINLFLPEPAPELFKVYIHSRAKPGILTFNENRDQAFISQKNIPKDAFVEIRVLASPKIFSLLSQENEERYQKILAAERKNFFFSFLRFFVLFPLGLFLMVILPIFFLIFFYARYGREPKIVYDGIYEHEPPRLAPPVTLPLILNQNPSKEKIRQEIWQGMFASLLDLATKGYITIREVREGEKRYYLWQKEKEGEIEPFSREIFKFFFANLSEDKKTFTEERVKGYLKNHSSEVLPFLSHLASRAKSWWELELKSHLLDPRSATAYRIYLSLAIPLIILGAISFGTGLYAIPIFSGSAFPFILIPAVVMIILFTFWGKVINRWSEPAYLEHKRWLNFKRFLTDFSALSHAPITLLAIWEKYFVYAVALGVAKEFLKNLGKLSEEKGYPITLPLWYKTETPAPTNLVSLSETLTHFNNFAQNFTSMLNSFSSSASSGGGFSGGGGGGGAGGSSGAG